MYEHLNAKFPGFGVDADEFFGLKDSTIDPQKGRVRKLKFRRRRRFPCSLIRSKRLYYSVNLFSSLGTDD
jgi:hypothetical protein